MPGIAPGNPVKLRQVSFDAKTIITQPDQPCQGAFLIEAGRVEIYRLSGDRKIVMAILGKGEIFGEMALIEHLPHANYARALEATDCLLISRAQYEVLFEQTPPIVKLLLTRTVRKLRKATGLAFGR